MKAHEFLAEAEATKSYEIKRGDTLSDLARTNNTTIDAIMDLNRGNRAIRDRDTIYAGSTIKIPTISTGFDSDTRVKRQGSTDTTKPDGIAKIGNQEFPKTPAPKVGPDSDMGEFDPGIDDENWDFPTVELGFGDPGYTPIIGNKLEKRSNGNWYYPGDRMPVEPRVARFAEKRLKDLSIVKSKDIGSQKFPMTKSPDLDAVKLKDILPIQDAKITSKFGPRSGPVLPNGGFGTKNHQGVDFGVPRGTLVYSPNNAVVLDTGFDSGMGNYIILGDNKKDRNITHKFYHLQKSLVKKGDTIQQGQVIAKSGDSGAVTGPHLHWEKWVGGQSVDPAAYVQLP
jgi:murein DD-endopeptidase MepM/ murein hydrolase activator NlpD